jgi:flagellin-like hook-associated protein FlgL
MAISGITGNNAFAIQTLNNMRTQLDELQRQMGTGKKSTTYAGLGLQRGLTVGLRTQLSTIGSFDDSISQIGVRLSTLQTSLTQIDKSIHSVKTSATTSAFSLDASGQTLDQRLASGQLEQIFGVLNTRFGDRYIFSGASPDQPSVAATDAILNGQGTRAGFKQVMAERNQADLGATGRAFVTLFGAFSLYGRYAYFGADDGAFQAGAMLKFPLTSPFGRGTI